MYKYVCSCVDRDECKRFAGVYKLKQRTPTDTMGVGVGVGVNLEKN